MIPAAVADGAAALWQTAAGACLPHFEPSGCRDAAGAPLAQVFYCRPYPNRMVTPRLCCLVVTHRFSVTLVATIA